MFKMVSMNLQRYISEHFAKLLNSLPDDVEMLSETGCLNPIRIGNKSTYFYKDIKTFKNYSGLDVFTRAKAREAFMTGIRRRRKHE